MPKFKIRHVTRYNYEVPVRDSANQIMLYPLKDEYQEILQHSVRVTGDPQVGVHQDFFGNDVGTFTHSHPHRELEIDSRLVVATLGKALPEDKESSAAQWQALEKLRTQPSFIDFLRPENFTGFSEVRDLVSKQKSVMATPLVSAKAFCSYVFDHFQYQKGITTVETTLDEVWSIKSGVCQDFAHILLVMLRQSGIPSRYVSGYICPNQSGMRGEGATHAWVEAYFPGYGWLGLDPTNNCVVTDTHVRLAVGKNFSDCSPVKGTYRGTSNHTMEVAVSVSYEDGHSKEGVNDVIHPEAVTSFSRNSFRRHQEMQMQQ